MNPSETTIELTVNGKTVRASVAPRILLGDFLRDHLGLAGTHFGCEQGACGACTVLLDGEAVRSCLMLAVQAAGSEVTTVEGLAADDELHRLQSLFKKHHALQCGFCTPGMLMSATDLLKNRRPRTESEVRESIRGNICRCTGYQNIVNALCEAFEIPREDAQ